MAWELLGQWLLGRLWEGRREAILWERGPLGGGRVEHWYALYTKPRKEVQVSEALSGRGIQTYLPVYRPRGGRHGDKGPRPVFPCYLFARVDFSSRGVSSVQWTPGLRRIVGFGGDPAVVPDEIVSDIRERLARGESAWWDGGLQPGDRVRIKSGPLKGFGAIFDRRLSSAERVRIFIDVLGRLRACQIGADSLEKMTSTGRA